MARISKANTTVANLGISASGQALFTVNDPGKLGTDFLGINATNSLGYPYYVKLYWTGNQNLSFAQMTSLITNAAATVVPDLTIQVPSTGLFAISDWPVVKQGQLYFCAVSTAADATNTSLATGGDVINIFFD
jgi:hypothetical protein